MAGNPPKTKPWFSLFIVSVVVVLAVVAGLWLYAQATNGGNWPPACDSQNAKHTLKDAFDQSQFARINSLSIVDVSSAMQLTDAVVIRSCRAKVTLNNGQSIDLKFVMEDRRDGTFMLTFEEYR